MVARIDVLGDDRSIHELTGQMRLKCLHLGFAGILTLVSGCTDVPSEPAAQFPAVVPDQSRESADVWQPLSLMLAATIEDPGDSRTRFAIRCYTATWVTAGLLKGGLETADHDAARNPETRANLASAAENLDFWWKYLHPRIEALMDTRYASGDREKAEEFLKEIDRYKRLYGEDAETRELVSEVRALKDYTLCREIKPVWETSM